MSDTAVIVIIADAVRSTESGYYQQVNPREAALAALNGLASEGYMVVSRSWAGSGADSVSDDKQSDTGEGMSHDFDCTHDPCRCVTGAVANECPHEGVTVIRVCLECEDWWPLPDSIVLLDLDDTGGGVCQPDCELDYPHSACARLIQRPPAAPAQQPGEPNE